MSGRPRIALTCDLEEPHHGLGVAAVESTFARDVDWILAQLSELEAAATFFVVGEVADAHPAIVKRIAAQGHEIGYHGATHRFLADEGPERFEIGIERYVPLIEDLAGSAVRGFRAPYFSLCDATAWCLDVLARHGFRYDASIYPAFNDRYGWRGAPRVPSVHAPTGMLLFPVPLLHPRLPIAFSGGAYLRILPWRALEWGMRGSAARGDPGMIYFHPWEISAELAWRWDAAARANLTRHLFRKRMRARIPMLLAAVVEDLGTMSDVLDASMPLPVWEPCADVKARAV